MNEKEMVAVTGADGFIGRHLCAALVRHGYQVRGLSRRYTGEEREFFGGLGVEVIEGDIRDAVVTTQLVKGAGGLFHLVGIEGRVGRPDDDYWEINVTALTRLIKAARQAGVKRFVSCSTADITSPDPSGVCDEECACATDDIYQITKAHGEYAALSANGEGGMEVTVARPTMVYGPGDRRRESLFKEAASGRFKIIGDGENLVHPVYVDDLALGLMLAYTSPIAAGSVYIIGGERGVTVREWIKIIGQVAGVDVAFIRRPAAPFRFAAWMVERLFLSVGRDPPHFRRELDFFLKDRAYSIDRARQELGYAPHVSLEEGAKRTLAWYGIDQRKQATPPLRRIDPG